jgi:hypothetical protein
LEIGAPQPYIPREQDLNAYPELDPVIAALNQGLEETGRAIELWGRVVRSPDPGQ